MGFLNYLLVVAAFTAVLLYYSVKFYMCLVRKSSYSQARLFLKPGWTKAALKSLAVSFIIFVAGRVVSFLVLFGALPSYAIDIIRNILDLTSGLMTVYSIFLLYAVIRPRIFR